MAVINEAFARKFFRNEDPIGKQLAYVSIPGSPLKIVGIIENIKEGPLDAPIPPNSGPYDLITFIFGYHDSVWMGRDRAAMNPQG